MLLTVLGLIDLLGGLAILYPELFSPITFFLSVILFLKGIYSYGSAAMNKYWFDWMGIVDIVTAIIIYFGIGIPYFWVLPIFKGVYTILMDFGSKSYL